jgi:3'(2'), 5'-bisphosphate nucleotidase
MSEADASSNGDLVLVTDTDRAAEALGAIALEAARFLAAVQDRGAGRQTKADGTPSTAADVESERMVLAGLARDFPDIQVVAEESVDARVAPTGLYFLVDPLDGTRDYLTGQGEYSVNVALVDGDRPIAAALAVPVLGRVWVAGRRCRVAPIPGSGACTDWRETHVRAVPPEGPVALASRRHGDPATEAVLAELGISGRHNTSSAAKFGVVASGEADVYVRCGPTMEWDTAAGDHIVTAAGGIVIGPDGGPLRYGRADRGFLNGAFAALGDRGLAERVRLPVPE